MKPNNLQGKLDGSFSKCCGPYKSNWYADRSVHEFKFRHTFSFLAYQQVDQWIFTGQRVES